MALEESFKEFTERLDRDLRQAIIMKKRIEFAVREIEEIRVRLLKELEKQQNRPLFDEAHKFLIGLSLFEFAIILYLILR